MTDKNVKISICSFNLLILFWQTKQLEAIAEKKDGVNRVRGNLWTLRYSSIAAFSKWRKNEMEEKC